jgi:hypothetical protein
MKVERNSLDILEFELPYVTEDAFSTKMNMKSREKTKQRHPRGQEKQTTVYYGRELPSVQFPPRHFHA